MTTPHASPVIGISNAGARQKVQPNHREIEEDRGESGGQKVSQGVQNSGCNGGQSDKKKEGEHQPCERHCQCVFRWILDEARYKDFYDERRRPDPEDGDDAEDQSEGDDECSAQTAGRIVPSRGSNLCEDRNKGSGQCTLGK